jgi:hypothetical protein
MREYTILGERCSGTNFLETVIRDNFELHFNKSIGWKHFFGYGGYNSRILDNPDIIYVCIVRNPVDWLMSFFKKPHHQHKDRVSDLNTFLLSEFYSYIYGPPGATEEWIHDRNFKNDNLRYKNIFEMRSVKCNYLFHEFRKIAKLYEFIRYEDLKHHPVETLSHIHHKFELKSTRGSYYIESKYCYSNCCSDHPITENYELSDEVKSIIKENLDHKIEIEMGYGSYLDRLT